MVIKKLPIINLSATTNFNNDIVCAHVHYSIEPSLLDCKVVDVSKAEVVGFIKTLAQNSSLVLKRL